MKRQIVMLFTTLILVFISGCSSKAVSLPDVGYPIEDFNSDMAVVLHNEWNSYKIGDDVILDLTLLNNKELIVPVDFNIEIYEYEAEQQTWQKIENFSNYVGEPIKLGKELPKAITSFSPIITDPTKPVQLFFVLYGNEIKDGQLTDTKIGAYGFVKLYPN